MRMTRAGEEIIGVTVVLSAGHSESGASIVDSILMFRTKINISRDHSGHN